MWYRRKKRTRVALKAKGKHEKCATKYCRNKRVVNNTGYMLVLCWKCRSRQLKERHPETYVLNAIRQKAKKRHIPFHITLAEFRAWCKETRYLEQRGQTPEAMTIDRKDHNKGYTIDNIQPMPHQENSENGAANGRGEQNAPKPEEWDACEPVASQYGANPGEPF